MAQWSTLEILQQAAGELGLPAPTGLPSDSVQDAQMLALLNAAGAELVFVYPWTYLARKWVLNTAAGVSEYALPSDWAYMLNQTGRDAAASVDLRGPETPQSWTRLTDNNSPLKGSRFRIYGGKLHLAPKPVTPGTVTFEYITGDWVRRSGGSTSGRTSQSSDQLLHDAWLLVKFLKYKYLQLKGLNSDPASREFTALLLTMVGKDRGGRVLSLTGRQGTKYINENSVPEGSWMP